MAAGLGFKTFTTGEVLTAADVNGYLMQGVLVFASATARDAAITSPQEGQFAYLKDTNVTTYYTGSAWANLDTTGMTNPMTTTGDTIYSSSGSTPARLGIGTAGQVLTVNSGATAPEWATPAGGGGKVLQVVYADTTTATLITTATYADSTLTATITPSAATSKVLVMVSQQAYQYTNGNEALKSGIKIVRAATDIWTSTTDMIGSNDNNDNDPELYGQWSLIYLDSPNTTSATTYKTQGRPATATNGNRIEFQKNSARSSMILMEIGA